MKAKKKPEWRDVTPYELDEHGKRKKGQEPCVWQMDLGKSFALSIYRVGERWEHAFMCLRGDRRLPGPALREAQIQTLAEVQYELEAALADLQGDLS